MEVLWYILCMCIYVYLTLLMLQRRDQAVLRNAEVARASLAWPLHEVTGGMHLVKFCVSA